MRCLRAVWQHYRSVLVFRILDSGLTVANIGAAAAVLAASLMAARYTNIWVLWASVAVLVTTVVQYMVDWRSKLLLHERSGTSYAIINRAIEATNVNDADLKAELLSLRQELDQAAAIAPAVPMFLWNHPKKLSHLIRETEMALSAQPDAPESMLN